MPWEGLLLVGKSCLWDSYPPFLLSDWNLWQVHWICYGVKKIIGRTNTCPLCHLLARQTSCKLLLHTRRCRTWKPPSPAIPRLSFSHSTPPSALVQILFSSTLETLWTFQTGAFQHHPILSVTKEKEVLLATCLGVGISALYPPPALLKIKHYFLSLLSYEAS